MNLYLLNTDLVRVKIIDKFISVVWADRFDVYGDFELHIIGSSVNLNTFIEGYYLKIDGSDHVMMIESIQLDSDTENGAILILQGRSLEAILMYRIVWAQTLLAGNFQTELHRVLNENAVSPSIPARDISKLTLQLSTDPNITSLTVKSQYTGDYLYDVVSGLCKAAQIGFKITINASNQFVFLLYSGEDRSYEQTDNDYVIFSPGFENLVSSKYFASDINLRTVALVAGEGEGAARLTTECVDASGGGSDLARREMFVDARDLSKTTSGGTLPDADYIDELAQRGKEKLAENIRIKHFEAEVDTSVTYTYGIDFFMGDIVQSVNEFGQGGRSIITEFIISEDENGINTHPTFLNLD